MEELAAEAAEASAEVAGEALAEFTRDQLYALAKEHNLPGRSSMSKEDLARGLAELGALPGQAEPVSVSEKIAE
jgi:N utilization substance protein A